MCYRADLGNRLAYYVDQPDEDETPEPDPEDPDPEPDPEDPPPEPDPEAPSAPTWRGASILDSLYHRSRYKSVNHTNSGSGSAWPNTEPAAWTGFLNRDSGTTAPVVLRTQFDSGSAKEDRTAYGALAYPFTALRPTVGGNYNMDFTKIVQIRLKVSGFGGAVLHNSYCPVGWVHFGGDTGSSGLVIPSNNWSYWTSGAQFVMPKTNNATRTFNFSRTIGSSLSLRFWVVCYFTPQRVGSWHPAPGPSQTRQVYGAVILDSVLWST